MTSVWIVAYSYYSFEIESVHATEEGADKALQERRENGDWALKGEVYHVYEHEVKE